MLFHFVVNLASFVDFLEKNEEIDDEQEFWMNSDFMCSIMVLILYDLFFLFLLGESIGIIKSGYMLPLLCNQFCKPKL